MDLSDYNITKLNELHRYTGRKLQRFHNRSSFVASYECLDWMCLENYVYAKKLLSAYTFTMSDSKWFEEWLVEPSLIVSKVANISYGK